MRVKRNKSCWPCRKRYCSRLLVTASLEKRRSYIPRTGVYEETRRPTSSEKGKKNLTAVLNVPGNLNLRQWVWIYSNQKIFSISQRQILEPVLKPALHSDTIHSISSPPFNPWYFTDLLPRAPRRSSMPRISILVNKETKKYSTYNINILMWACVILKFPQTYFEGRSSDVLHPNTGGVSLQSCMVMRNGYKNWRLLGKLNPQRKMRERAFISFCKQAMRKVTVFWDNRIKDN